ncbi:hypothetical protein ERO13_D12G073901v2, partial [Gossypium hirsutum]
PFIHTQCQCIHARSIFPCQDTPVARIRYSALLNDPRNAFFFLQEKRALVLKLESHCTTRVPFSIES